MVWHTKKRMITIMKHQTKKRSDQNCNNNQANKKKSIENVVTKIPKQKFIHVTFLIQMSAHLFIYLFIFTNCVFIWCMRYEVCESARVWEDWYWVYAICHHPLIWVGVVFNVAGREYRLTKCCRRCCCKRFFGVHDYKIGINCKILRTIIIFKH